MLVITRGYLMAFAIYNINQGLAPRLSAWWANVEPSASAFATLLSSTGRRSQNFMHCEVLPTPSGSYHHTWPILGQSFLWPGRMKSTACQVTDCELIQVPGPWLHCHGESDTEKRKDWCAHIYRTSEINQNHPSMAYQHQLSSFRRLEGLKAIESIHSQLR